MYRCYLLVPIDFDPERTTPSDLAGVVDNAIAKAYEDGKFADWGNPEIWASTIDEVVNEDGEGVENDE